MASWIPLLAPLLVELLHLPGLYRVGDVDVGLHRLVVFVAGPFHHHVDGDAQGETVADERFPPHVGCDAENCKCYLELKS